MTYEEAIAWCVEHNAQIDFTTHDGLHWVRVYLWRDGGRVVGAGYTLVEAVEAAVDFVRPEPTA
jgi:hypothetical protein